MVTWITIALLSALLIAVIGFLYQYRARIKIGIEFEKVKTTNQSYIARIRDLEQMAEAHVRLEEDRLQLEENDQAYQKELIVQQERLRIAQELHDDTVQRIIIARFRLINTMHKEKPSIAKDQVNLAVKDLQGVIDDLRFLIDNEVKPMFQIPDLVASLKKMVDEYNGVWLGKRITLDLRNSVAQFTLTSEVTRDLYYIVHETITNAIKNSVANEIRISLEWGTELTVSIKDNGQSRIIAVPGKGTWSIRERAARIGAEITERNSPFGYRLDVKFKRPA